MHGVWEPTDYRKKEGPVVIISNMRNNECMESGSLQTRGRGPVFIFSNSMTSRGCRLGEGGASGYI